MDAAFDPVKQSLHGCLRENRVALLSRVHDLGEHDLRRPLTPTGTNLLGLVKHLAGIEYGYFGEAFGRPPVPPLPWYADGSVWDGADMWAREHEPSHWIVGLYQEACDHADETIGALPLDAPASVPWWPEERRDTTLHHLLARHLAETARHAGHADIVRELVDGETAFDRAEYGDRDYWTAYATRIQQAADAFEPNS